MRKQQPEWELQKQVATLICRQYPKAFFLSDARAFLKLTIPQANRSKQVQKHGFACPDMIVFEPRGDYHGLFLELKAKTPYKRDGTLRKDEHLEAQQETINALLAKGYFACFAWDLEQIQNILREYMNQ